METIAPRYVVYVDGEVVIDTMVRANAELERDMARSMGEIVRIATVYPRGTISKLAARIRVLEAERERERTVVEAAKGMVADFEARKQSVPGADLCTVSINEMHDAVRTLEGAK